MVVSEVLKVGDDDGVGQTGDVLVEERLEFGEKSDGERDG